MHWLHVCLQHDYHPTYDEETVTNNREIDEETVMRGLAQLDNQDSTGIDAAVAGSLCDLPNPAPLPTVAIDIPSSVRGSLSYTPTRRTPTM